MFMYLRFFTLAELLQSEEKGQKRKGLNDDGGDDDGDWL